MLTEAHFTTLWPSTGLLESVAWSAVHRVVNGLAPSVAEEANPRMQILFIDKVLFLYLLWFNVLVIWLVKSTVNFYSVQITTYKMDVTSTKKHNSPPEAGYHLQSYDSEQRRA